MINDLDNASECWEYLETTLDNCCDLSETDINDYMWFDAWDDLMDAGLVSSEDEDE